MIALMALLAAITVSVLVGRVATQAFEITGLSREAATFQARSALTGTGFTTRAAESVVDHPVRRRFTTLEISDFFNLLSLQEDYTISSLFVREDTWLSDGTLAELELPDEGILILGIRRDDGSFVGAPRGRYTVNPGDTLVLYGLEERLSEIRKRMQDEAGEKAREEARAEHEEDMARQDREELEYQKRKKGEEDHDSPH